MATTGLPQIDYSRFSKHGELMLAAGVVIILFVMLVPLPTFFLDIMLCVSISISLLVLVTTMFMTSPLEFTIFPSLLLVTTLLRLALNVASTRLILLNGDMGAEAAGSVIRAFGEFVVGGSYVVGGVIFMIMFILNKSVITAGTTRIAEVAARFTLDAMPGKQMAIDADLNSGLIDEQQARERRSKIQREADFFGSMDGATKFVKGDAIISIIITFINFVGGLIVGIMNSQGSIQDIMQIYTTSTIGDGLVSQIPALLISVATGMVVTRSASENSLSEDLTKQFLAQPRVLMTAGGAAACLCLIPGFPVLQILIISAGMVGGGYYLYRHQKSLVEETAEELVETEVTSEASYYKNIENIYGLLNVE